MLGKELLYNHDNSLVRLKRLSKSDSASHVTILVSGFLSEADTGLEWIDALSADPTQTFYTLNWKASSNKQVAGEAANIVANKGL